MTVIYTAAVRVLFIITEVSFMDSFVLLLTSIQIISNNIFFLCSINFLLLYKDQDHLGTHLEEEEQKRPTCEHNIAGGRRVEQFLGIPGGEILNIYFVQE